MLETLYERIWKHVQDHLHVIKEHWLLFASVGAISFLAAVAVTHTFDNTQIANLQTQVGSEQSHSALLREQLTVMQQNQAAAASAPPSQWRRLSDRERDRLLYAFRQSNKIISNLVVYAMADSEPRQYAAQFVDVARAAGIEIRSREVPLSLMADVGIMVGITNYPNPSERAMKLKSILDDSGISTHYTLWMKIPGDDTMVDFDLFIGPKPW